MRGFNTAACNLKHVGRACSFRGRGDGAPKAARAPEHAPPRGGIRCRSREAPDASERDTSYLRHSGRQSKSGHRKYLPIQPKPSLNFCNWRIPEVLPCASIPHGESRPRYGLLRRHSLWERRVLIISNSSFPVRCRAQWFTQRPSRTTTRDQRRSDLPNRPNRANATVQSPLIWGMSEKTTRKAGKRRAPICGSCRSRAADPCKKLRWGEQQFLLGVSSFRRI